MAACIDTVNPYGGLGIHCAKFQQKTFSCKPFSFHKEFTAVTKLSLINI